MGRGNESLFAAPGSHDQDGPNANTVKTLQKSSSPEPVDRFPRNLIRESGTLVHHSFFKL